MMTRFQKVILAIAIVFTLPASQLHAFTVAENMLPKVDFLMMPPAEHYVTVFALPPADVAAEIEAGDNPIYDFVVKEDATAPLMPMDVRSEILAVEDEGITPGILAQEIKLDDIEVIPVSKPRGGFWTKRKLLITSGILLSAGLLFGILAFSFGGSGSGSTSGNGGFVAAGGPPFFNNSNPPDLNDPNNPNGEGNPETNNELPGGGGPGDNTPTTLFFDPTDDHIPNNPEPSTFLLLGLGLFLPWLRRRKV